MMERGIKSLGGGVSATQDQKTYQRTVFLGRPQRTTLLSKRHSEAGGGCPLWARADSRDSNVGWGSLAEMTTKMTGPFFRTLHCPQQTEDRAHECIIIVSNKLGGTWWHGVGMGVQRHKVMEKIIRTWHPWGQNK